MPHGSIHVGRVRVTALCDGEGDAPSTVGQQFPTVTPEGWAEHERRTASAVDLDARWHLHDHCFLIQAPSFTLLVDTGIGPRGAPAARWLNSEGRLPDELAAAGVTTDEVDVVVITHLHLDHIGWNVTRNADRAPVPTFGRARYVVHRRDWTDFHLAADEEDMEAFAQLARPLEELDVLELVEDGTEVSPGAVVVHAPGHTPGHICLELTSDGDGLLLAGDLLHHPVQLIDTSWRSRGDQEPAEAAASRARMLARVEGGGMILATAHLDEPFGRVERDAGARRWRPLDGSS